VVTMGGRMTVHGFFVMVRPWFRFAELKMVNDAYNVVGS
jgi:hypothetical protein